GTILFTQEYDPNKWEKAASAALEAIEVAHSLGYKPYQFEPGIQQRNISDSTILKMNYRGAFSERWNSEIIWANTNSPSYPMQRYSTPRALEPSMAGFQNPRGNSSVPLKIASLFYTQ